MVSWSVYKALCGIRKRADAPQAFWRTKSGGYARDIDPDTAKNLGWTKIEQGTADYDQALEHYKKPMSDAAPTAPPAVASKPQRTHTSPFTTQKTYQLRKENPKATSSQVEATQQVKPVQRGQSTASQIGTKPEQPTFSKKEIDRQSIGRDVQKTIQSNPNYIDPYGYGDTTEADYATRAIERIQNDVMLSPTQTRERINRIHNALKYRTGLDHEDLYAGTPQQSRPMYVPQQYADNYAVLDLIEQRYRDEEEMERVENERRFQEQQAQEQRRYGFVITRSIDELKARNKPTVSWYNPTTWFNHG